MAIDFTLTPEQKALQTVVREYAQQMLAPATAAADRETDPQKAFEHMRPA